MPSAYIESESDFLITGSKPLTSKQHTIFGALGPLSIYSPIDKKLRKSLWKVTASAILGSGLISAPHCPLHVVLHHIHGRASGEDQEEDAAHQSQGLFLFRKHQKTIENN